MNFLRNKIVCVLCSKQVKNKDLATIKIKCVDGVINRKICRDCEKVINGVCNYEEE